MAAQAPREAPQAAQPVAPAANVAAGTAQSQVEEVVAAAVAAQVAPLLARLQAVELAAQALAHQKMEAEQALAAQQEAVARALAAQKAAVDRAFQAQQEVEATALQAQRPGASQALQAQQEAVDKALAAQQERVLQVSKSCMAEDAKHRSMVARFMVVATACLLVAGLPVSFLSSLQSRGIRIMREAPGSPSWQKQLRAWRLQDRLVVVLGTLYVIACVLYMVMFLANVGIADHGDWTLSAVLALLQELVIMPFAMALALPLFAQLMLAGHLRVTGLAREHFARAVCEQFHRDSNAMLPIEHL